jgi:hypothetical protein
MGLSCGGDKKRGRPTADALSVKTGPCYSAGIVAIAGEASNSSSSSNSSTSS